MAPLVHASLTKRLFLAFLVFRLLNALLIETFHVPDEYWQSVEVAHRSVFGYGFLTWEWQPAATLRSFLHPSLYAGLYMLVSWTGLDRVWPTSLVVLPKLLQGLIAALGDASLHSFVAINFGSTLAMWYTIVNLTNWFLIHNLTRTLANSIETSLFSLFLSFWPVFYKYTSMDGEKAMMRNRRIALVLAGLCFVLRPTSAVSWAFFAVVHLYETDRPIIFLVEASGISFLVLLVGAAVDVVYYGTWASPLLSFLKFNFLTSGAAHYGSHPWHWYVSSGLPMLLGPYLLPTVVGLFKSKAWLKERLAWLIGLNLAVFSLIGHKEGRFLMPLIPILHLFAAKAIMSWWEGTSPAKRKDSPSPPRHIAVGAELAPSPYAASTITKTTSQQQSDTTHAQLQRRHVAIGSKQISLLSRLKRILVLALVIVSLAIGIYTSAVHQRGTISLMTYVREHPEIDSLLLLMPCHHTPGLAYVHRPTFRLEYLDCSPGLPDGQLDEADTFYDSPGLFLSQHYPSAARTVHAGAAPVSGAAHTPNSASNDKSTFIVHPTYTKDSGLKGMARPTLSNTIASQRLPSYIAMYNALSENSEVSAWMKLNQFTQVESFFHTHAPSGRVGSHVVLYAQL